MTEKARRVMLDRTTSLSYVMRDAVRGKFTYEERKVMRSHTSNFVFAYSAAVDGVCAYDVRRDNDKDPDDSVAFYIVPYRFTLLISLRTLEPISVKTDELSQGLRDAIDDLIADLKRERRQYRERRKAPALNCKS